MEEYTVIIGDIVNSRGLKNREAIQKNLIDNLKIVNTLFKDYLIKDINFTTGDEFQGIFNDYYISLLATSLLIKLNYQIQLRFGIGNGKLHINPDLFQSTNELDGECYHNARLAIDQLDNEIGIKVKDGYIINVLFNQFANNYYDLNQTNRLIYLYLTILNPFIYQDIINHDQWNQMFDENVDFECLKWHGLNKLISNRLKMTTQNISKNIRKYHLKYLLEFEQAIYNLVKDENIK